MQADHLGILVMPLLAIQCPEVGQIDLPRSAISGLKEANLILQNIEGIDIVYLDDKDVIRHKVVKKIIEAYKKTEHAN